MRHPEPHHTGPAATDAGNPTVADEPAGRSRDALSRGNFFAIDVRVFRKLTTLGANATADYLVLVRGSGRDQRTSSWGVQATTKRVGLARPRGKDAREKLVAGGLVKREGSASRPTYKIVPAHEVPGCEGCTPSKPERGQWLLDWLRHHGPKTIAKKDRGPGSDAQYLVSTGFARWSNYNTLEIAPQDLDAERPRWAWLPNAVVDGVGEEDPPVQLLRQRQDPAVIQLFVELYHAHNLAADGGVGGRLVTRTYERQRLGERAGRAVWAFSPNGITAVRRTRLVEPFMTGRMVQHGDGERDEGWDAFFDALNVLMSLGLVEFVAHLFEGDTAEAELIHPCPERGTSNCRDIERQLTSAAHSAALRLLPNAAEAVHDGQLVVPVPAHIARVEMRGVLRLRYRPHTAMTSEWAARSAEWAARIAEFDQIPARTDRRQPTAPPL